MYTTCQTVTASKAGQTGDGIIRNTRDKKTLRLPATRTVAAVLQKPCGFLARQLYRPESDGLASRMVSLLAPLLSDVTLTLESSVTSIPSLCLQHTSTESTAAAAAGHEDDEDATISKIRSCVDSADKIRTPKGRGSPVLETSVGFRSWSRSSVVSPQVTEAINPAVGCHYLTPGPMVNSPVAKHHRPWLVPNYTAWWQRHMCVKRS